jgi:hypothetical protein
MSSLDNSAWTTDPNHPFVGIAEKLKRVDQNIVNLNTEITAFIDQGEYPTMPHPDDQCWPKAVDYHRNKSIPLRFSVLSGEIIHLRSALDHIVWYFSSEEARLTPTTSNSLCLIPSPWIRRSLLDMKEKYRESKTLRPED